MILYTQRLILRPFTIKDIDALYEIFKDKEANTYLPWFPLKSKEEALTFFKEHYLKEKGFIQG